MPFSETFGYVAHLVVIGLGIYIVKLLQNVVGETTGGNPKNNTPPPSSLRGTVEKVEKTTDDTHAKVAKLEQSCEEMKKNFEDLAKEIRPIK